MNQQRDIVIIGCGAGGSTAAQFARKTDRKAQITIFEKEPYSQYSKCGLPYSISGEIPSFNDLIEYSEDWFQKQHIDMFLNTIVERIDLEKKVIIAKTGERLIQKPFTHCIIATGATIHIPPIEGITDPVQMIRGVYPLRTLDDAKQISSVVKKGNRATIVGVGLIGLEMASSLHKKGMHVTVVEALPTVLANTLDPDMSQDVLDNIPKTITFFTNTLVSKIETDKESIKRVHLYNTTTEEEQLIETDLLILATGTKPEVALAQISGCRLGDTGAIVVNEKAETSETSVYAVGDCTEYLDFITKEPIRVGLGSIVVRQGIAAGINAAGGSYTIPVGLLQTRTTEVFDNEIAAVGPTSESIKNTLILSGKFKGSSLPEYFPGGKPITIKIIIDEKTGSILAAQAVGSNAALRMNTFACAIMNQMNIEDLRKLETAYAPSIAPTLDVITLACDVLYKKLQRRRVQ